MRSLRTRPKACVYLADQRRPQELARVARGRLSAAHQSTGGHGRRDVGQVHAVDRGRGGLPRAEERAFDSAAVSSKEPRVKAHVMVAFLGYALWVTLKHLLKRRAAVEPKPSVSGVENAQPISPMRTLSLLSTLQSADIVLPTTDGREIRLRRITEPTAEQKSLLTPTRHQPAGTSRHHWGSSGDGLGSRRWATGYDGSTDCL
jgi:hypothetical protein